MSTFPLTLHTCRNPPRKKKVSTQSVEAHDAASGMRGDEEQTNHWWPEKRGWELIFRVLLCFLDCSGASGH